MERELLLHKFSQLCYLDATPLLGAGKTATVGALAAYYSTTAVGRAYMRARFGAISKEFDEWTTFLAQGVTEVADWRIVQVQNHNAPAQSGLYACTYASPEGEKVAAFRGSEMLGNSRYKNDYVTDFALSYMEKTLQQEEAEEYLQTFPCFAEQPYELVGHSLGGNLALHAAVFAPKPSLVRGCYAFNAPGFNAVYIDKNQARVRERQEVLHVLENEYDLVSSLLIGLKSPSVLRSAADPYANENPTLGALLYPHSNFMFLSNENAFLRQTEQKKSPLCQNVHRLSRLFLLLPESVRHKTANTMLTLLYSAKPREQRIQFFLEGVTKCLLRNGISELGEAGLAFCSAVFAAKQLTQLKNPSGAAYESMEGVY